MLSMMIQKDVESRFVPRPGAAPGGQTLVTVSGRAAWLTDGGAVTFLRVALKVDSILEIRAPSTLPQPVLLRFAAGITILPGAAAFDASL